MFNDPAPPGYAYPQFYPQAPQYQPFTPTMGGFSQTSPIMASLVQMGLQSIMGGNGSAVMGISDQNIMDRFRQSYYTRQNWGIMQDMAELDRSRIVDAVGTGYAMINRPFTDARETAHFASGIWNTMGPIAASMSPEFADSLFGLRGSAAAMGVPLAQLSRGRFDPGTGFLGMERGSASALGGAVFDEMFGGNRYLSSPLPAGQAGQLWRELQAQGMVPGTSTLEDLHSRSPNSAGLRKGMQDLGFSGRHWEDLSAGERDKLLNAPEVQSEIRAFDAKQISGTLQEWGKSIEAMREIFGDAGMPNAPIPLLMQSLRQLTAGGMAQMNPSELSTMVRTFSGLAQSSGLGMQGATMLVQAGEAQAARLGVASPFAMQASMDTMAYMTAYSAMGRGQYGGWGSADINQLAQARQQLVLGGVGSTMGNQAGLAARTKEAFGPFKAGTRMAKWMEAVRSGQATFNGNEAVDMQDMDFAAMMAEGTGQGVGEVVTRLAQTASNEGGLFANPEMNASIRRIQAQEVGKYQINIRAGNVICSMLGERFGYNSSEAGLGDFLSQSFSNVFMDSKRYKAIWNAAGNAAKRASGIADEMYADVVTAFHDMNNPNHANAQAFLGGRSEKDAKELLAKIADTAYGEADTYAREQGLPGAAAIQQLFDPQVEAQAQKVKKIHEVNASLAELTGRGGKGNIWSRLMEGLQSGKVKNLSDLSTLGLGGVDEKSLREIASGVGLDDKKIQELRGDFAKITELKGRILQGGGVGAQAQKELDDLKGRSGGLVDIHDQAMKYGGAHNIDMAFVASTPGSLGAVQQRLLGFSEKTDEQFKEWVHDGGLGKVRQELADYKKSDSFKNLKDADKRIAGVEDLLKQAEQEANPNKARELFGKAFGELSKMQEEEKKMEDQKPIHVTSSHIYFNGTEVKGDGTIVVGGNSTTNGAA